MEADIEILDTGKTTLAESVARIVAIYSLELAN